MDEEAVKRNTDCVYFLASPLTCKKGIDCEYRHSEPARLHPRDCWYWLGGNCLNAKCPFRHPPLDGRPAFSATAKTSALSRTVTATSSSTISPVPNKSKTPCYFFSQGYCSRGNRCAFLHGSLATLSQSAVAQKLTEVSIGKWNDIQDKCMKVVQGNGSSVQKLPEASICEGLESKDKPVNVVNGIFTQTHTSKLGVGISSAPTLPSHVFIRAQNTSHTKNDALPPLDLSSKSSNVQTPVPLILNPSNLHDGRCCVYGNIGAPSSNLSHFPTSHDRGQCKEQQQQQQQPSCVEERWGKMVRSSEMKQGTWREGLLKDVYPDFVDDESDKTVYRHVNRCLPYFDSGVCSPRMTYCDKDAHDFGQAGSEHRCMPCSQEFESHIWHEQLNGFDCRQSFSKSRGRQYNRPYLARRCEHKTKDLRDRLSKRKISDQDQFLDFEGHTGAFGDHDLSDERDWVDSTESAPSETEQETSWRKFKRALRRRVQSPKNDFEWDAEGEDAEVSSGSLSLRDLSKRKPYFSDSGWYSSRRDSCHLDLDRGKSLQTRLGSRVHAVSNFQDEGEFYSGSCSRYMAGRSIKSRILSASGSGAGQAVEVLNDFEGPKPLSVLLQAKQQGQ